MAKIQAFYGEGLAGSQRQKHWKHHQRSIEVSEAGSSLKPYIGQLG